VVLCTANRCRSPLAGAVLEREVQLHRLPVSVVTAGFSEPEFPATAETIDTARGMNLDLVAHRSRAADPEMLAEADLVIGMERRHVREAVVLEPTVWRHAFTLLELVRRAEAAEPRSRDETLTAWLERLSAGRERMELMGASPDDDIADPTTDWTVDHESTARLIDDLVRRLVTCAWPS
jgi:protein-tyrosine phosphatase